jgi:hypothetical protein
MPAAFDPMAPVDIVILTNGPGEVTTWVKPVVQALVQASRNIRISVMLSPCPHASGQEHITLAQYPEVNRVQSAAHFFKFLLTGKTVDSQTAASWDWHSQGVVVFLGGDQLYTVMVAKWLGRGYRTVTYSEWDARWPGWIDRFGVMQSDIIQKAPDRYRHKFALVGDLMADVQAIAQRSDITEALGCALEDDMIGFLPGSKPLKLGMGVPLMLAIAQNLHLQARPSEKQRQYVIGVAPNLTLPELMRYTDPAVNPAIAIMNAPTVKLIQPERGLPYLQIQDGPKVFLWQRFPALDLFSQCSLCFTTIGANTAQLGALATPMIVVIPTQQLDGLKVMDGLPGLLARLPGVGVVARKILTPLVISAAQKSGKHFAWPNIWANREVVPELFGPISAQAPSALAHDYLTHREKLDDMRQILRSLRGPAGAADKMAKLILETLYYSK